jgi:hypothetical protein
MGMQVSRNPASLRPDTLVIMGGLLMPNVPVNAVQVKEGIGGRPERRDRRLLYEPV